MSRKSKKNSQSEFRSPRQPKNRAPSNATRGQQPEKSSLKKWLGGIAAGVIVTTSPAWAPAAFHAVKDDVTPDPPALTATAEPTFLDDQGSTMVLPITRKTGNQISNLLSRKLMPGSPDFIQRLQAMGGVDVDDISIQLVVNGNSPQGVRIIGIRPINLHVARPLDGALFFTPSQAGNATIKMMFDLDEPNPIARDEGKPKCHVVTQGNIARCVTTNDPYPQQPLAKYAHNGAVDPGKPFFPNETIHLSNHEQQVLDIRAQVTHFSATFDLEIDYIVGNKSGDIRKLTVSNRSPLRVTGMPPGPKPETVSYQEAFASEGAGAPLCPVADPRSIPMDGITPIPCKH